MPSLVFNEAEMVKNKKNPSRKKKTLNPEEQEERAIAEFSSEIARQRTARRWMVLGVSFFVVIIALLWGWSIKLQVSQLRWSGSAEEKFIEENKKNWDAAFNRPKAAETAETTQQKIKEAITFIIENTSSTASTASSTPTTTVR